MSNINLIKEIKKHNIITEKGRINANIKKDRWWEIRKLKKIKIEIEKQNPKISDLLEKLYFIYFELVKIPSCETCGEKVAFNSFQKGYKRHCSSSCATLNKDVQKTRKNTCTIKYGVKHHFFYKKIKNKIKEKFIEKYGVDNPVKSFEIKEKLKNAWSEKKSEEKLKIKQKITKTFKKYKNGHPMKDYKIVEKLQKKRKQTIEDLEGKHIKKIIGSYQDKFKQVGVELIKYEGTYLKEKTFTFKCYNCNNIFSTFLKNQKWIARCPHCYPKNETKAELEIFKLLNIHQNLVLKNDRVLLKPLELDIFSPDLKFAVEYDGLMYHSFGKNKCSIFDNWKFEKLKKNNHLNKTLQCKEKGVQLFHIFENEWNDENKRKIWTSMINNKLGGNKKIFARKCTIKVVDKLETKLFLEKTHLQGYISSSINIGLYYNNELIQIMTFGKARYNSKYNYEIIRFSTKLNHTVTGGASKIFKYFTNNFLEIGEKVITYADLRHSIGNIYEKLGFSFIKRISPNFFYFLPGRNIKLLSRLNFQKHKLKRKLDKFDKNKSNIENIYDNGYRKIYDCGNNSYGYKK